jgi:hypothetical protein
MLELAVGGGGRGRSVGEGLWCGHDCLSCLSCSTAPKLFYDS